MADVKAGRTKPARQVFDRLRPQACHTALISRDAEAELEELYLWVVGRAPRQGAAWFNGLSSGPFFRDQHPERCPVAPESVDPAHPVRVLSYGRRAPFAPTRFHHMIAPVTVMMIGTNPNTAHTALKISLHVPRPQPGIRPPNRPKWA